MRLVTEAKKYQELVSRTRFVSQNLLKENLVTVRKIKEFWKPNKLAYVDKSILDLNKTLMYGFCCYYVNENYDNKAKRYSLPIMKVTHETETEQFYKGFHSDKNKFGFSIFLQLFHSSVMLKIKK